MATQEKAAFEDTSILFAGAEPPDDDPEPTPEEEVALDRGDQLGEEEPEPKAEEPEPKAEEPEPKAEEPEPEPEPKNEGPVDGNGMRIPKWRLDQEVAKRRRMEDEKTELERRLRQLEQGRQQQPEERQQPETPKQPAVDLDDLDAKYHEAVLDGNLDQAKELRRQIREAEHQQWLQEARQSTQQEAQQLTQQQRIEQELQAEANRVIEDYPIFDQQNEKHDPDLLRETIGLRDFYMQQMGYEPRNALREAADTVAMKYGVQKATTTPPPAAEPEPKAEEPPKPDTSAQRKQEVASRQPPRTKSAQGEPQLPDVATMRERDFDKMAEDEEAMARARGDIL